MKVKSNVTGKEYEVDTFSSEKGLGIQNDSLLHILENELTDADYDIEVITATEGYCAVKCTIKGEIDGKRRKVERFNDVNASILENRDPSLRNFAKEHPLITATNAVVASAVKAYLGLPNILGAKPELHDDKNNTPDKDDEIPEILNDDAESESEFTGMNPPEPADDDIPDGVEENTDEVRLKELGASYPPANCKYGKLTLDEIWEKDKGWMDYIKNNNRSKPYEKVREYIKLREKKEGEH